MFPVTISHQIPFVIKLSRALYKNNTFCFICITFHSLAYYDLSQLQCWITVFEMHWTDNTTFLGGEKRFLLRQVWEGGSFVKAILQATQETWHLLDRFSRNLVSEYFSKICPENWSFIKKEEGKMKKGGKILYMKTYVTFIYLNKFSLEWEDSNKCANQIRTSILCSVTFFPKIMLFERPRGAVRAVQATDDNMMQVHCMLDNKGYKHMLRIHNTYWFLHCNHGHVNTPQCYGIRTLPVLLLMMSLYLLGVTYHCIKMVEWKSIWLLQCCGPFLSCGFLVGFLDNSFFYEDDILQMATPFLQ